MLKAFFVRLLWLVAFAAPAGNCSARDYLKEGDQESDHPEQSDVRYDKAVRHVLWRAWQKDVAVRTVHLPPFDPEWIAGVIRTKDGYRAFKLEASSQIWGASHHPKRDLPKIRAIYRERPITDSLAERIGVWRAVLGDRRNYGKDPGIYLDTSQLIFFVGFRRGEHPLTANTKLPDRNAKSRQLWDISIALLDYVEAKSSADALDRIVGKGKKKVGLN